MQQTVGRKPSLASAAAGALLAAAWFVNLIAWAWLPAHVRRSYFVEYWSGTQPDDWQGTLYSNVRQVLGGMHDVALIFDPGTTAASFAQGRDMGGPYQFGLAAEALLGFAGVLLLLRLARRSMGYRLRAATMLLVLGMSVGAFAAFDRSWSSGWSLAWTRAAVGMVVGATASLGVRPVLRALSAGVRQWRGHARSWWPLATLVAAAIALFLGVTWGIFNSEYRQTAWEAEARCRAWLHLQTVEAWGGSVSTMLYADTTTWYELGGPGGEWAYLRAQCPAPGGPENVWVLVASDGAVDGERSRILTSASTPYEGRVEVHAADGAVFCLMDARPAPPAILTAHDVRSYGLLAAGLRPRLRVLAEAELPDRVKDWLRAQGR